MNTTVIIPLIIIAILTIITSIYLILYYKMLYSKIRVDKAEEVILDEIKNRIDLIHDCKKTITKQTKKELTLFNELDKIIKTNISSYELEKKVSSCTNMIYLIKEDYPKLDSKKEFKEVINKLNESDTRIEAAKNFYNVNNDKLKQITKKFPAKIISIIHKFKVKPSYNLNKDLFNEKDDGIKI